MHAQTPGTAIALIELASPPGSRSQGGPRSRTVRRGQRLFREGQPVQALYVVQAGTFRTSLGAHMGGEHVTGFPIAGDLMGFDALADGVHPTTATALEDAQVCLVALDRLDACALDQGEAWLGRLFALASAELAREERMVRVVANGHSAARVANFLLHMSARMVERGYSPAEFHLRMSRSDIASCLGLAPETVSRHLGAFTREGWIQVEHRRVRLLSMDALHAVCDGAAVRRHRLPSQKAQRIPV